ncbi:BTB/POZ domain protein [Ancylostoma ceylanicum]|uniref:BTB/POZ domain protein n=1 Tax=Ancylostoma ceylanicum TaxID=53326 RepID=A0A0D6L972_9BILA|nr:BTB/POZ domain protein [Ancylostoma ceylanicum]
MSCQTNSTVRLLARCSQKPVIRLVLVSALQELLSEEYLCDVHLVAGGERIPAHKIILAAYSPFFKAMFRPGTLEANAAEVAMPNIDAATLRGLVRLAYGEEFEITERNIQAVIITANFLQLDELEEWCENYLFEELLDENNALSIHKMFTTLHSSIATRAEQYVKKSFSVVAQTEDFLRLSYEDVKKLLSATDLHASSEKDVFWAAMRWIEFSPERMQWATRFTMPWNTNDFLLEDQRRPHCFARTLVAVAAAQYYSQMYVVVVQGVIAGRWHQNPSGYDDQCGYLPDMDKYDPLVKRWITMTPMTTARAFHAVAECNGKLYVIGGETEKGCTNSVEFYDPIENKWKKVASMRKKRSRSAAAVLDNKLYVCGGRKGGNDLASVEVYDPKSNHWTFAPSMTKARSGAVAGVVDGYIYVVSADRPLSAERLSPLSRRWEEVNMVAPDHEFSALTFFKDKIYAFGRIPDGTRVINVYKDGERYCFNDSYISESRQAKTGSAAIALGPH